MYALIFGLLVCKAIKAKKFLPSVLMMILAAAAKFLTLYIVLVKLVAPTVVPAAKLPVVTASFTWPQLVTACIGGLLACLIGPVVYQALSSKKS